MDLTATVDRPGGPDRLRHRYVPRVEAPAAVARTHGWDGLLLSVAAYVLTAVGRIHQLFSALEVLHLAALAGLFAMALYVLDGSRERRAALLTGPTTTLVALLLFWMMMSVPFALSTGASFDLVFNNFLKTAVMAFVVAGAVRRVEDVERLTLVYFAGAVIYSIVVMSRFNLGDGSNWRLGHLYYYDANDFATFTVTAIPFGIYFLHSAPKSWTRAGAAIGLVVLTLGFVWSGSRGGFIALSAVAAYILLRYSAIPLRWRVSATALVAIVLFATASDHYWQQMETITSENDYNHTSETGRIQIWKRGMGYMLANPLLGVGPNNFPAAEGTLSPMAERQQYGIGVRWNAPHDCFVQIGAETGLPGLALFVAILVSAFAALRQSGRAERAQSAVTGAAPLTPALTASLIGFVVGGVFLSLAYSEMLYTLIAFAVGLRKVTAQASDD
jgi:probable O-glycosylation ligase (exosortase A-associated)